MIVSDLADLKLLMNGQRIDVLISTATPVIGSTVSVQPAVGEKIVCRAQVLDAWQHVREPGRHVVVLGAAIILGKLPTPKKVRRVIICEEPVRLMKSVAGSTADARHAMGVPATEQEREREPDKTGVPHPNLSDSEPEMVPRGWKDPGVPLRAQQQAILDEATRDRLSLGGQVDALLREASGRGLDVHDRKRKIQRELQLLEQDLAA